MKRRLIQTLLVIILATLAFAFAAAQGSQSNSTSTSRNGSASASGSASAQGSGSGSGSGSMRMATPTHAISYVPGENTTTMTTQTREQLVRSQEQYMQRLANEGKVLYHGPWRDEQGALTILTVRSDQDATAIIAGDPAVQGGLYEPNLRAWTVRVTAGDKSMTGIRR